MMSCQLCLELGVVPNGADIMACPICSEVKLERKVAMISDVSLADLRELLNRG